MAVTYMTEEGYKKLIEQIKQLESVERPRISAQIAEARDKGDLSENAEYDAAKEAQGLLEMKIAQLKDTLANARILDESMVSADSIQILSKVRVKDQKSGREMQYTLVSENEANIREGKLAVTTPIAKALMGKKVGDVAEADTTETVEDETEEVGDEDAEETAENDEGTIEDEEEQAVDSDEEETTFHEEDETEEDSVEETDDSGDATE